MQGSSFSKDFSGDGEEEREENSKKRDSEGLLNQETEEPKKEREGNLITQAVNHGVTNFTPDLIFERLVSDYKVAEQMYGPEIIRELSDFDPNYVKKNINIPEFQKEIKKRIRKNVEELKKDEILDKDGNITDAGIELSLIQSYLEELDNMKLLPSYGERQHKRILGFNTKTKISNKKERYRDVILPKTIHRTLRRNHSEIDERDIVWAERKKKANIEIIFALDTSASMKGKKIQYSKMAGVGLAYWATSHSDKVGLINFSKELEVIVKPTKEFSRIAIAISKVSPGGQTDISLPIEKACKMVDKGDEKELIIISDALHTSSKTSEKRVIESVYNARDKGLRVSIIGIHINKKGRDLAKQITDITDGHLYEVKVIKDIPTIVISDYVRMRG
jgi:Mg-chelatase subunit ChlD